MFAYLPAPTAPSSPLPGRMATSSFGTRTRGVSRRCALTRQLRLPTLVHGACHCCHGMSPSLHGNEAESCPASCRFAQLQLLAYLHQHCSTWENVPGVSASGAFVSHAPRWPLLAHVHCMSLCSNCSEVMYTKQEGTSRCALWSACIDGWDLPSSIHRFSLHAAQAVPVPPQSFSADVTAAAKPAPDLSYARQLTCLRLCMLGGPWAGSALSVQWVTARSYLDYEHTSGTTTAGSAYRRELVDPVASSRTESTGLAVMHQSRPPQQARLGA